MSPFKSILLPLDGSPESARAVGCAVWLSERLGVTLHVLHSTAQPLTSEEALGRLRAVEAQRTHVVLHQTASLPERAVLDAISEHAATLVVMSARGVSASSGGDARRYIGRVAQALLEQSPAPILLIPARYRESLPWRSMLIAASGERSADQALAAAVRLSSALQLKSSVLYVEEDRAASTGPLTRYADAPHHEFPERLEQMIRRAVACCSVEECHCIEEVLIRRGDPVIELLGQVQQRRSSVLVLGWHGAMGRTRAPVLTRLLERAECPLLIIRESGSKARLKVGDDIGGGPL